VSTSCRSLLLLRDHRRPPRSVSCLVSFAPAAALGPGSPRTYVQFEVRTVGWAALELSEELAELARSQPSALARCMPTRPRASVQERSTSRRALLTRRATRTDLCSRLLFAPAWSVVVLRLVVSSSPRADVDHRPLPPPKVRPRGPAAPSAHVSPCPSPGPINPISSQTLSHSPPSSSRSLLKSEPCLDRNTPVRHPRARPFHPAA